MSGTSQIEWTDVTWNPVAGCSIASAGCSNCYAMRMAGRLEAMQHHKYIGTTRRSGNRTVWTGRVNVDPDSLSDPKKWKTGRRIFVNSMSDLFHENVPDKFIVDVWNIMAECPHHQFQVLTKRPKRMASLFNDGILAELKQVWIGTSVENADVTSRIEDLVSIPNMTRFISFEPLIGPVGDINLDLIHWVIVGGESGPGSREMRIGWVDQIKRSCRQAGSAFFFKQWGGLNKKATGRKLRGKTYDEYPAEPTAFA